MKINIYLLVVIQIIFILFTNICVAANPQLKWRKFGYSYGDFNAVAYNPVNHQLYAFGNIHGADYGDNYIMYTSPDTAKTWIPSNEYPMTFERVTSYKINSKGQQFITAGYNNSLYRSDDDGKTFNEIYNSTSSYEIADYEFSPKEDIYILSYYDSTIFFSRNNGNSWDSVMLDFKASKFNINTNDNMYLLSDIKSYVTKIDNDYYLDSCYNNLIFYDQSKNKNELILRSSNLQNPKRVFLDITSDEKYIYVLSANMHYQTDYPDYEEFWYYDTKIIKIDKSTYNYSLIEVPISDDDKYYEGTFEMNLNNENKMLIIWNSKVYQSDTTLNNWNLVLDDFYIDINSLNIVPNSDIVITESEWDYIYLSTNGGDNFKECKPAITKIYPFRTVFEDKDSVLIVADTNNRIYQTYNDGLVWKDLTYDFDRQYRITCFARSNQNNLIVGTENNGIYYLVGEHWISKIEEFNTKNISQFCCGNKDKIFFIADSLVYQIENEFQNGLLLYDKPTKQIMDSERGLFIITYSGELYLYDYTTRQTEKLNFEWTKNKVTSIAMNNSNTIIAGTWKAGVFRSTDLGLTWEPANFELYSPNIYQVVPMNYNEFLAVTVTGFYYTNNNGDIWEQNYLEDDNSGIICYDLKGEYKLFSLENGCVFKFYKFYKGAYNKECDYLNEVEDHKIEPQSGWVDSLGFKENKRRITYINAILSYSDDGFVNNDKDILILRDDFLRKYDVETGFLIWERYFPYHSQVDIQNNGKNIFYSIGGFFSEQKDSEVRIYNIDLDSNINIINLTSEYPYQITSCKALYNEKLDNMILGVSYIDTSIKIGESTGSGELQIRNLDGSIIELLETKAIGPLIFSPDCSFIFYLELNYIKKVNLKDQIYFDSEVMNGKILNLITREEYTLEISDWFNVYQFSPDNRFLICNNGDGGFIYDIMKADDNNYITVSIDKEIQVYFQFMNNTQILQYMSLYDIVEKIIIKQSKTFYNTYGGPFKLSSDKKKFIVFKNHLRLFDMEKTLDSILVDVPDSHLENYLNLKVFPNPFSEGIKFRYYLDKPANVNLVIYNSLGQEIAVLVDGWQAVGEKEIKFDGSGLSAGVYYYKFTFDSENYFGKMMLVK